MASRQRSRSVVIAVIIVSTFANAKPKSDTPKHVHPPQEAALLGRNRWPELTPDEFDDATPKKSHAGRDVVYTWQGRNYQGYLALPPEPAPRIGNVGALVAHQWMGLNDFEKARVDEFAALGYHAFALDAYGQDVRCHDSACAKEAMHNATSNATLLQELVSAGTQQLLLALGDGPTKLVATGYCLGGQLVLELARHPNVGASKGVTFAAVSSFHGLLEPLSEPAGVGEIVTRVHVHHGDLDFQGGAALTALEDELRNGVNGSTGVWETHKYGKCAHAFSEPGMPDYDERAAKQSHGSTYEFFRMALATPPSASR